MVVQLVQVDQLHRQQLFTVVVVEDLVLLQVEVLLLEVLEAVLAHVNTGKKFLQH